MRAISKEPVPYVCEMDRSLPEEEQTVFWVKPKTHQAVNKAMERYGGTFTEDSAGYKTYNVPKLDEADQRVCDKCGRKFPADELEDCWGCSRIFCRYCIGDHDCTPEDPEQ